MTDSPKPNPPGPELPSAKPVKVAIIEDQRDIREGLAWIIKATDGFVCTGAYRSVEEAVDKSASTCRTWC